MNGLIHVGHVNLQIVRWCPDDADVVFLIA